MRHMPNDVAALVMHVWSTLWHRLPGPSQRCPPNLAVLQRYVYNVDPKKAQCMGYHSDTRPDYDGQRIEVGSDSAILTLSLGAPMNYKVQKYVRDKRQRKERKPKEHLYRLSDGQVLCWLTGEESDDIKFNHGIGWPCDAEPGDVRYVLVMRWMRDERKYYVDWPHRVVPTSAEAQQMKQYRFAGQRESKRLKSNSRCGSV